MSASAGARADRRSLPTDRSRAETPAARVASPPRWGKVIDQTRCIGCHACTIACKSENGVPLSVNRTYVKHVESGAFPDVGRAFQVTRCNQCEDAPCVTACPTAAMFRRADGIVDFDKSACVGCKACLAACPYDAIFINPRDHSAEKCNFCAHRIDNGIEPACVVVCPTQAIIVGDLDDAESSIAGLLRDRDPVTRRPEVGTGPSLFYLGGEEAAIDPLAARRPEGDLFAWSEQGPVHRSVPAPSARASPSAAALLAYDVPHAVPWDWRVSLYTWTKAVAAGAYLAPLVLALAGALDWRSSAWLWAAPAVALAFLGATGLILIADLEHPRRFAYIFLRPQWRSWLVRGAVIIAAYGAVLIVHLVLAAAGAERAQAWLAIVGAPLAIAAAGYTAFLFAQARGRDLWQSRVLGPHMLLQALMVGASVTVVSLEALDDVAVEACLWLLAAAAVSHLAGVAAEVAHPHPTAQGRAALRVLTRGRYAPLLAASLLLALVGALAPLTVFAAVACALLGLLLYEHAYVQSAQAVPLA